MSIFFRVSWVIPRPLDDLFVSGRLHFFDQKIVWILLMVMVPWGMQQLQPIPKMWCNSRCGVIHNEEKGDQ